MQLTAFLPRGSTAGGALLLVAQLSCGRDETPCPSLEHHDNLLTITVSDSLSSGIVTTTGSCEPCVCTMPTDSGGCTTWVSKMLPPESGLGVCAMELRYSGGTQSDSVEVVEGCAGELASQTAHF
ncbi:hypothetical protein BH09MYX1_BH09MYX1_11310 [soil metagenome]